MNIFYLDPNPRVAAQYHLDKHVVKMILESAQLLSTAHHVLDGDKVTPTLYKATHKNHPSAVWCRSSLHNYTWLYELFIALCDEYTFRYGKIHLTDIKLRNVLNTPPKNISVSGFTPPTQAMPDQYKQPNAVEAYRQYYIHEKNKFAVWSKRQVPQWYNGGQHANV